MSTEQLQVVGERRHAAGRKTTRSTSGIPSKQQSWDSHKTERPHLIAPRLSKAIVKRNGTETTRMKRHAAKFLRETLVAVIMVSSLSATSSAATLLSGKVNVDDIHQTFISTSNTEAGTLIAEGDWWPDTQEFSDIALLNGQDYYLHVWGKDAHSWVTGFLGEFHLMGSGHLFANGSNSVTTNAADWLVSTTGWGGPYGFATEHGINGSGPWANFFGGPIPDVSPEAFWIWSTDAFALTEAYFSLSIIATAPKRPTVQEPATQTLVALGIAGVSYQSRRKRRTLKLPSPQTKNQPSYRFLLIRTFC